MKIFLSTLILLLSVGTAQASAPSRINNIVIVHGAFADGSGWEGVYQILKDKKYNVTIVQNPLVSLEADATATQEAITKQNGPVILVGHSYGGMVITQAGNNPNVKALVYVAAFVPDLGESLASLSDTLGKLNLQPAITSAPIGPAYPDDPKNPENNSQFLLVNPKKFPAFFAADVKRLNPKKAQFMADSQAPLAGKAYTDVITPDPKNPNEKVAWMNKPSYYIIAGNDHMIAPVDENWMAKRAGIAQIKIKTVKGSSHAVYLSHPDDVADVIEKAAKAAYK